MIEINKKYETENGIAIQIKIVQDNFNDDEEEEYDIVDERLDFLDYMLRVLKANAVQQAMIYPNDKDYLENIDEDFKYHKDLIETWSKELRMSN